MRFGIIFLSLFFAFGLGAEPLSEKKEFSLPIVRVSPAMRAVQIPVLECENQAQVRELFTGLKSIGINTVIVRVFHNPKDRFHKLCVPDSASGVYFKSQSAPVVCELVGILAKEAHLAGLKFYAWMNTRSADYGLENRSDLYSVYYELESGSYKRSNRLCIFHPEVVARLKMLYLELAEYGIDGILVQDDLMLRHNEDFHPNAVYLYQLERGKVALPSDFYQEVVITEGRAYVKSYKQDFWRWSEWKSEKLLELAGELKELCKAKNPRIRFGLNFYYESALFPEKAKAWMSQDLSVAQKYNFDFYILMLYHRQIGAELNQSGLDLEKSIELAGKNFLNLISPPLEPVFKLMLKDFNTGELIPEAELKTILKRLPKEKRAGLAFFPFAPGTEAELYHLISNWEQRK